jgi:acetyl-CoA acetyltransferase
MERTMSAEGAAGAGAIVGLGMTEMGKVYGRSATAFAMEAVKLALDDAGLTKDDLDGLLINTNMSPEMTPLLQMQLGLKNLTLLSGMNAYGATAGTMLSYASMAIREGLATTVALVYADAPLVPRGSSAASYARPREVPGIPSLRNTYGQFGPTPGYAMATQRHMDLFGTTSEQLGAIAVSTRAWATLNPQAQMREPITLEDHQASRMISSPLRLLDCCLVSNGAVAVIVTSSERAASLRQPSVWILGTGQGSPGDNQRRGADPATVTGAQASGAKALHRAGVELSDIDVCEIYDCYTYTTLVTLEDYGFCPKGDGGAFVEDGKLGPGGALPTNTGGGQLSSFYMWGMTPVAEAVIQLRGQGGERQVDGARLAMVSGNGGVLNFHSTTILGSAPA